MSKLMKAALLGAFMVSSLGASPASAKERKKHDKNGDATAAVIIAGIVGLGVGVAMSKHGKDHDSNYAWDQDRYGQPFSPTNNVHCYPKQRLCYRNNHIAPKWTRRIFGDY